MILVTNCHILWNPTLWYATKHKEFGPECKTRISATVLILVPREKWVNFSQFSLISWKIFRYFGILLFCFSKLSQNVAKKGNIYQKLDEKLKNLLFFYMDPKLKSCWDLRTLFYTLVLNSCVCGRKFPYITLILVPYWNSCKKSLSCDLASPRNHISEKNNLKAGTRWK